MEIGVNAPPFHVRCRSTIAPEESEEDFDYFQEPEDRKANDKRTLDEILEDWESKAEELSNLKTKKEKYQVEQAVKFNIASDLSDNILKRIKQHEPTITVDMQDIVQKSNGHLKGLEFKLKSDGSLIRKILADSQNEKISLSEAAFNINVALRYTTIFDEKTFGDDYIRMKKLLIERGYDIIKVKNTWGKASPYRGVNTVVKKGDIAFEMQYHTEESFSLKNGPLHKMYEEFREVSTSEERKKNLLKKC